MKSDYDNRVSLYHKLSFILNEVSEDKDYLGATLSITLTESEFCTLMGMIKLHINPEDRGVLMSNQPQKP